MSGGSLDYVCYKLDDAIEVIERRATTVLQKAFAAHLKDVSKALHDLEWVFSGDYGDGDDVEALRDVLQKEVLRLKYPDADPFELDLLNKT